MFVSPVVQQRPWQILNGLTAFFASRTQLVIIPPFPDEVMLILAGILRVSSRPFPMFSHQSYHIRLSP